MMPPGSRASLAEGFVSPAMTFGQAFWFCLPPGPTHAFAGEFDAVGVVNETVQDGIGIGRIADYLVPSVYWKLGGKSWSGVRSVPRGFLEDHAGRQRRAAPSPNHRE